MGTTLGRVVEEVTLRLVRSDPFQCVMTRYDAPEGTPGRAPLSWTDPPTLEFPDAGVASWVATVSANQATFDIPAASVDALIATGDTAVRVTVGGVTWALGIWLAEG